MKFYRIIAKTRKMNKLKEWIRNPQVWGFALGVVVMAVIALAFFYPDNFEGNSLRQADMLQGAANGQEAKAYYEATGEKALWTDALFGGMPTFQISPSYPSNSLFTWLNSVYGLGLPAPSNLLFMMMLGFFILMFAMRFRWYYALIGAVAWGFSSYFVIIIGAGHIWKFVALTYVPPTVAGLMLVFRRRYVVGAAMLSIFAMLQLNANHAQMTYYFGFLMAALMIAWLIEAIRKKDLKHWTIAFAVTVGAGALAIGANLPSLYNTYEYSKQTKRSQSELTPLPSVDDKYNPKERPTGGLPKSDILGWCYGQSETFSLVVPNIKGGASAKPEKGGMVHMGLDRLPGAQEYADTPSASLMPYMPQYFNDSEGTNGPVYVGAVVCVLFLIGCCVVKGPVKWALVVMTVLSILLAWGRNFEWLTDLFIYNVPMYNKFRAVESILVVAEFTMPLLGLMGLREILSNPDVIKKNRVALYVSFGFCALIALLAAIAPGLFGEAITSTDRAYAAQIAQQVASMAESYGYSPAQIQEVAYQYSLSNPENVRVIEELRYGLVRADGWRSFIFIALAAILLWAYAGGHLKKAFAAAGIGVLVLIDLYGVDKRYVDHDSFIAVSPSAAVYEPDEIDKAILADTTHHRVMDIPGFWRADRSYFHNTVGGYHAAKLNRYEDLIQRILNPVLAIGYHDELRQDSVRAALPADSREVADRLVAAYRVLDMLNARYIITGDDNEPLVTNSHAMGPAWLVDKITYVENADSEMAALMSLDPGREAVAEQKFAQVLGQSSGSLVPGDTIRLVSYTPNRVVYSSDTRTAAIGVFSEVWFPWGWNVTIDGQPAELGRVDYVLRAVAIPAGKHEIAMTFNPSSLRATGGVAYACVSIIYLLVLLSVFIEWRRAGLPSGREGK